MLYTEAVESLRLDPRAARLRAAVAVAVLLVATFVVHGRVLGAGYVGLDDADYVRDNAYVLGGVTLDSVAWAFRLEHTGNFCYFHPLTWVSLMLDTTVFGSGPWGHHLVNVLLHGTSAILLLLFLLRTTRSFGPSLVASLLFAMHPLTVEAVAWVTERKAVLSTALGMAAVLAYAAHAERPSRARLACVASLACAAVLAKPTLVVLPALLLVLDFWPLGRVRGARAAAGSVELRRLVAEKAALAVPAFAAFIPAVFSLRHPTSVPLALRIENAVVSIPRYVAFAAWPVRLSVFHPFPDRIPFAVIAVAALACLALTGLAAAAARRWPFVAAGWAWFLVAIAPYLGLKQDGLWPAWADRFMYLPLIGLAVLAAFGGWAALGALPQTRRLAVVVSAAVVVPLALATYAQGAYWETSLALFGRAVAVEPSSGQMNFGLGAALARAGRTQEALAPLARAARLQPSVARAHATYGLALVYEKRFGEAQAEIDEALRLEPGFPEALFGRAQLLASLGLRDDAQRAYVEFLQRSPDTPELSSLRAEAVRRVGR